MVWVCLAASACGPFHRRAKLPQPVPPAPAMVLPPNTGQLNPPPDTLPMPQQPVAPAPAGRDELPEPKPEKKTTPRRVAPRPVVETPVEVAPPAQPKPLEIPQLAPMMTAQETSEFNRAIDAALTSAEKNLRAVRSRDRNSKQQTMLEQAEAFARQARETRASDPVTAKSLAERADQLSRELVSSYR